jgi:hypothetical protein
VLSWTQVYDILYKLSIISVILIVIYCKTKDMEFTLWARGD